MAKINLHIEAATVEELQTILGTLQSTQSTQAVVDAITKTLDSEAGTDVKPAKEVEKPKGKKTATKKEKASTESTADAELSKTGKTESTKEVETPVEKEEVEKSATAGKYPDASKEDVQAAMKKAMSEGKRDAIMTAFSRSNATKLSELKEEDYSVFLTDLEVLAGE